MNRSLFSFLHSHIALASLAGVLACSVQAARANELECAGDTPAARPITSAPDAEITCGEPSMVKLLLTEDGENVWQWLKGKADRAGSGWENRLATMAAKAAIEAAPAAEPTRSPSGSDGMLTPELAALRDKVRQVLAMYATRHQNTRDNTPWEVMHAIIAYGVDTQLYKGGPGGEKVNAIGWMCYNNTCAGEKMLILDHGKVDARRGPGVQGHAGQFLAILAQSHVKSDYPLYVGGKSLTLEDLIEHEKEYCFAGEELTFKLIALMHYLDSDATWMSKDGQEWSIQKLLREELKQPIRGAACGGTHRLMGYSYAVNKRIQRGKPIVGEFRRAQAFLQDYHRYTFSLQNPDGSFSTEWFTRRGNTNDVDRKLKTSGHILEWITFSLSDDELRDPRMIKAVDFVSTILLKNDRHKWEIGPLGHGLHALAMYNSRMFKEIETAGQDVAGEPGESTAREARLPAAVSD